MMNRKKAAIAATCGALCAFTAVGGTLAYLTDQDSLTNTFTVGSVKIEETEPNFDPDDAKDIVPSEEVKKDPQVTNVGKNDAYVYMSVTVPVANVVTVDEDGHLANQGAACDTELFALNHIAASGQGEGAGWALLSKEVNDDGDMVYLYTYDQILKPEETTMPLFTSVTFVNLVEGELSSETLEIPVASYAIQTLNTANEDDLTVVDQAKTAWEKYLAQNTPAVSDKN